MLEGNGLKQCLACVRYVRARMKNLPARQAAGKRVKAELSGVLLSTFPPEDQAPVRKRMRVERADAPELGD